MNRLSALSRANAVTGHGARGVSFIVCALALALTGCASLREPVCAPGAERSVNDLLYFGTATPGGVVTSGQWAEFLSASVTPRFPQGLSVWPATGQWKGADGTVVREASFVLNLVHPDDDRSEGAIREITGEYKARFSQEAVLRVKSNACVSF